MEAKEEHTSRLQNFTKTKSGTVTSHRLSGSLSLSSVRFRCSHFAGCEYEHVRLRPSYHGQMPQFSQQR